jgi:hypothetical protein
MVSILFAPVLIIPVTALLFLFPMHVSTCYCTSPLGCCACSLWLLCLSPSVHLFIYLSPLVSFLSLSSLLLYLGSSARHMSIQFYSIHISSVPLRVSFGSQACPLWFPCLSSVVPMPVLYDSYAGPLWFPCILHGSYSCPFGFMLLCLSYLIPMAVLGVVVSILFSSFICLPGFLCLFYLVPGREP